MIRYFLEKGTETHYVNEVGTVLAKIDHDKKKKVFRIKEPKEKEFVLVKGKSFKLKIKAKDYVMATY